MEKKIFWITFTVLGVIADLLITNLPLSFFWAIWCSLIATIPIAYASWWIAYRSDWF